MLARAVVEQLDVIKYCRARIFLGSEVAMVHQFVLQIAEEAFCHGIIVSVALAAHARTQPMRRHGLTVVLGSVNRPLISVMNQSGCGPALLQRHLQSPHDQSQVGLLAH